VAGRRERQKQLREARILRAAAKLFETKGYERTGMQDIARRANLAVGTIYNYFPSKPEIVLVIVRRDATEGLSDGEKIVKRPPRDPIAAVRGLVETFLEPFARHDRALWRELVSAALADPNIAAGFFATDMRLIGQLSSLLRALQGRGDLRPNVDPGRGAIAIYGVFFSWFMAFCASEAVTLATLRAEIATGIELVMGGFIEGARTQARRKT
jgi:AcrR family transcriptional regulator